MVSGLTKILNALGCDTDHFEPEELGAATVLLNRMLHDEWSDGYRTAEYDANQAE